jgi:hypothetical protein
MLPQSLFVTTCVVFAVLLLDNVNGKLREGDCEVCIKFLGKFEKTLTEADRKDQDKLTTKLKKACNAAKNKENRFCYYVGGTKDAATYILKDITKPLSFFKPVENICEALKKKDPQVCELQYEKELDWKNINLKKMRVKELKNILGRWGESCNGCLEKSDYIKKIEAVKNKHIEL